MAATSRLRAQLDDRVGHVDALIGHGERLGLKSEGLRQRSPILCDAIGVSLRRVVNLLCGSRIHRYGPEARGVRRHRAGLVWQTGLPHRHHQCSAGADRLGGFADSPTRRVRAVVSDEDRHGGVHPSGQLDVKNFKTRCHNIAWAVSRHGVPVSMRGSSGGPVIRRASSRARELPSLEVGAPRDSRSREGRLNQTRTHLPLTLTSVRANSCKSSFRRAVQRERNLRAGPVRQAAADQPRPTSFTAARRARIAAADVAEQQLA